MRVGDKIRMEGERQRYTIMARDSRYVIMTKPFNAKRTYQYSIADLSREVRGPCNLIFGPPAALNTTDGAAIGLDLLQRDEMGVSYRRCKELTDDELKQLRN